MTSPFTRMNRCSLYILMAKRKQNKVLYTHVIDYYIKMSRWYGKVEEQQRCTFLGIVTESRAAGKKKNEIMNYWCIQRQCKAGWDSSWCAHVCLFGTTHPLHHVINLKVGPQVSMILSGDIRETNGAINKIQVLKRFFFFRSSSWAKSLHLLLK